MYFDDLEVKDLKAFADIEIRLIEGGEALSVAIEGNDFYVYRGSEYYKKWDICAGEAIINSLGGIVTDPFGKKFSYDEWDIPYGQIICYDRYNLERILAFLNHKEDNE